MPIEGIHEFDAALSRMIAAVDVAARRNVAMGAALIEKLAKQNFQGSHKKGQPHVGGDKPNVVTGTLRRSITHEPVSKLGFAEYRTRVGPSVIYARRVELGYRGSRGYPYFTPAAHEADAQYGRIAEQNWREALSRI